MHELKDVLKWYYTGYQHNHQEFVNSHNLILLRSLQHNFLNVT